MFQLRRLSSAVAIAALAFGCGGGGSEDASSKSPADGALAQRPGGRGVCGLLMQAEVDEFVGAPVGAGASESLEDGSGICSWPSAGDPALLLQVGPASADVKGAVDLGEGYRVVEVSEMSGPAAMALQSGEEETVALLAVNVSEKTLTLSPIGLGLKEGTPKFQRFKALVELAASRL